MAKKEKHSSFATIVILKMFSKVVKLGSSPQLVVKRTHVHTHTCAHTYMYIYNL